jgi:hypothetical protein
MILVQRRIPNLSSCEAACQVVGLHLPHQPSLLKLIWDPAYCSSLWKMFFDGASSKEGVGAGVVFVSPCQETIPLSYKLEFEATNNVAEYEALILGLRDAKDMGIEEITIFGDA